ncbi:N-acetylmuramoyl-L-alanine amidase [Anaerovibrio sp. RM50]|uniref:N-acetylmuramoyl-L-alanine amidase n=1 Tax=Anaerovibrio sp. RM50 TaxID=1200557 RepID=UPI0005692918|nr:N-acetylmuramoyl-L-alanine amidase [Anaerovibrio sp. RM50]
MHFLKAKGIFLHFAGIMLLLAGFLMFFASSEAQAATFAQRMANMAEIKDIRVSSNGDRARIVLDTTKDVTFKTSVLSNPQRIVVDIQGAWISSDLKKTINVGSRFAKSVRLAQFDPNTVRVVIESSMNESNRNFFTLNGGDTGHRLVLDFGNVSKGSGGAAIDFGKKGSETGNKDNTQPSSGDDTITPSTNPEENKDKKEEVIPVVEPEFTPGIKGKKITIDAGHGGSDVGAIGPTGVTEKSITLRIAQELQRQLKAEGAEVIMTRIKDTEVSPKRGKATDIEELQARCDVANKNNSDIFVSIHMDSFTSSSPSGTTGYYYGKGTKASVRLAQCISDGVVSALSTGHRGVKSCNFYVVRHTTMPAVLLETAFISNEKEERLLNSDAGIKKAASGILAGIRKFFG